ncbi:uncharacterized protein LOC124929086 [Impatiens glandulifera]|uniref:uncharacterized protein LOC124929086 n=1 Tax=Impatiens glandulifera TaxID=253017 RepID=UPI001FB0CE51|nr:uncharacterized protein LOC124929086 [Impatiens glandulifera]
MDFTFDDLKDDIRKTSYNKSVFDDGHGVEMNGMEQNNGGRPAGCTSRTRSYIEDLSSRRNEIGIEGSGIRFPGRMRFSNLPYVDQYEQTTANHYLDRVDHVQHNGRDELLKKIDELKDQIIRSCDIVTESPRQRFHKNRIVPTGTNHYAGHGYYTPNLSNNLHNRHVSHESYGEYNHRPLPPIHKFNLDAHEVYPVHNGNWSPNQTAKRPSDQIQSHYPGKNYHRNFDGNRSHDDREAFYHKPDCSCLKCYADNILVPETSDFIHQSPGKMVDSLRKKLVYKPIAGGAPFMLCTSCFELLKLPRKGVMNVRNEQQLCCGNCSAIFFIRIEKNKIVPIPKASNQVLNEVGTSGTNLHTYNHQRFGTKESCSIDFDNSSFDFHFTVAESNIVSVGKSEFGNQEKATLEKSISPYEKMEEGDGTMKTELNECLVTNHKEDTSVETEMDDQVGISQERNHNKTDLGKEIPSSSGSVEMKPNVFINGKPLADHIVQKAEKFAGPIQPGNYWYDFQAGFWGVIGHPCLGIIPPFIEELSCPMPDRCGGGNTEIYVNGRELHDRDLDLLANRGLPTTRNKSYVVLFSGRVFDKYTGHELKSIGQLAPTVQRQMCGYGMKVPRFLSN